jgi:hypothetical protein
MGRAILDGVRTIAPKRFLATPIDPSGGCGDRSYESPTAAAQRMAICVRATMLVKELDRLASRHGYQ